MPVAHLHNRALIDVAGPDAEHFLQNIITTDLDSLAQGEAKPGALLTPQGKILFDFLIARKDGGFILDCRADIAEDFLRRLMLYRLRANVQISQREQPLVAVSWQSDSAASQSDSTASRIESGGLRDSRFPADATMMRHHAELPAANADATSFDALRILHGVAESGTDYALGDAFPHDVLLDQNGGVGFRKGCYVGQEVVSRMQHRGTARRRVLIASGEGPLTAGAAITAGGKPVGALGTVSGHSGLAIARIDRVKEAVDAGMPIAAEGVALTLAIPSWAGFTFPAEAAAEA